MKLVTPPAVEPVSLADVKLQLQIDSSDTLYDDQINALIPAAREWCEQYQSRAYITQTWEMALDDWPSSCNTSLWVNTHRIKLPRPPLQSVDAFLYTVDNGTQTTWSTSSYAVDTYAEPGQVVPVDTWPRTKLAATNGIVICYTAGYGDNPNTVPHTTRQAIIMLTAHWFNNGLCDPPNAVYALLDLERVIPV